MRQSFPGGFSSNWLHLHIYLHTPNEPHRSDPYIFSIRPFPNENLLPRQDRQILHFVRFLPQASNGWFFPDNLKSSRNLLLSFPEYLPVKSASVRSEERRVGKECRSRWSVYE